MLVELLHGRRPFHSMSFHLHCRSSSAVEPMNVGHTLQNAPYLACQDSFIVPSFEGIETSRWERCVCTFLHRTAEDEGL